jgi:hypothetical protein
MDPTPDTPPAMSVKIINALLYLRHALVNDWGAARATYATPENLAAVAPFGDVERAREADPDRWWNVVAAVLWRVVLTAEQKDAIRLEFMAWKAEAGWGG